MASRGSVYRFMTSRTGLDAVRVFERCLFLSSPLDPSVLASIVDHLMPGWTPTRTGLATWSFSRRTHTIELRLAPSWPQEHRFGFEHADHPIQAAVALYVNDLEAEAAAWQLARVIARGCQVTWFDGGRSIVVEPVETVVQVEQPAHPRELWSSLRVLLVGTHVPPVESIADAIDSVATDRGAIHARMVDRDEIVEMNTTEDLSVLDARLLGGAVWGLDVEAWGVRGYASAVELALKLSAHGPLVWRDELGHFGSFIEGSFDFDGQPKNPDGVLYLREHLSDWDVAEYLVEAGAEREADTYGRARWRIDFPDGSLTVTIENDGVIEQLVTDGTLRWLAEFEGRVGTMLLFEVDSTAAWDAACTLVTVLTASRRGFWLTDRGRKGWLGPVD